MADEDEELDQAATIEEALRILLARRLRERFPGLGLTDRAARALAGSVVPESDTVIRVIERPDGVAIVPAPRPAEAGALPLRRRRHPPS